VDNSERGFQRNGDGWRDAVCGVNGSHLWVPSATDAARAASTVGVWSLPAPAGLYALQAYIPPCGELPATSNARYTIVHDAGVAQITADQQAFAGGWVPLGTYSLGRVSAASVKLAAHAGDDGFAVRFDALAWVPVLDTTAPQAQITSISRERNGYRVQWIGEDDLSGVASYDVQVRQEPDGLWRTWMRATDRTSNWFGPDEGRHFGFRVRARDHAGNEQAWRDDVWMSTTQATP